MKTESPQNVLITGINGFVGHHLTEELASAGHNIYGASREGELSDKLADKLTAYYTVDLSERSQCDSIDWSQINSVVHLAGLAAVGPSFDNPKLYHDVNVGIARNLFESAKAAGVHPRIIAISTGAVYGHTDGAVTESTQLQPGSPYAESKLEAEKIVSKYRAEGFDNSVSVRPFNHVGPGQGPGFLVPDLGYQIAEGKNPIKAGNLSSSRDYTDVRDVVRAYRLLAEAPKLHHEVYNVCSGTSIKGETIFELFKKTASKLDLKVEVTQSKLRANDDDIIVGSNKRLHDETGWQPEISIEQTIKDFYDSIS